MRVVAAACALWSAATIACGLSRGYGELAAARMAVGVGEAGGVPPSYSIIADLFPAERRGVALALYNLGPPIGQTIGVAAGAAMAVSGGWRLAFVVVGLIRIVTAIAAAAVLREPRRGNAGAVSAVPVAPAPFNQSLRLFWADRVLRLGALAAGASAFVGSGTIAFITLLLMREKGMTLPQVASYLSITPGICICGRHLCLGRAG